MILRYARYVKYIEPPPLLLLVFGLVIYNLIRMASKVFKPSCARRYLDDKSLKTFFSDKTNVI